MSLWGSNSASPILTLVTGAQCGSPWKYSFRKDVCPSFFPPLKMICCVILEVLNKCDSCPKAGVVLYKTRHILTQLNFKSPHKRLPIATEHFTKCE